MIPWYVALIALFVGAGIGLFTTTLCVAAKDADSHIDYHIDNIEIRKGK